MLGKLLVRIEMKIKLSIPSTTSMAISVARATQVVGSEKSWMSDSIGNLGLVAGSLRAQLHGAANLSDKAVRSDAD